MSVRAKSAMILRNARDLMNDGGRHWIKGAESGYVNPETHEPGDSDNYYSRMGDYTEEAFCMIGGIYRAGGSDGLYKVDPAVQTAAIALARVINPKEMERSEARATKNYDRDVKKGYWTDEDGSKTSYIRSELASTAEGIITSTNDAPKTTWEDVRGYLTEAARRLR